MPWEGARRVRGNSQIRERRLAGGLWNKGNCIVNGDSKTCVQGKHRRKLERRLRTNLREHHTFPRNNGKSHQVVPVIRGRSGKFGGEKREKESSKGERMIFAT